MQHVHSLVIHSTIHHNHCFTTIFHPCSMTISSPRFLIHPPPRKVHHVSDPCTTNISSPHPPIHAHSPPGNHACSVQAFFPPLLFLKNLHRQRFNFLSTLILSHSFNRVRSKKHSRSERSLSLIVSNNHPVHIVSFSEIFFVDAIKTHHPFFSCVDAMIILCRIPHLLPTFVQDRPSSSNPAKHEQPRWP
jgi:hypothetical protein